MLHPKPLSLSLSLSLIPLFLFFLPLTTSAFTLTRPPNNLGLVGYWSFDTSTIEGTTVHDLSGMGNHGTIYGATQTMGKIRQSLSFDGTDDYINIDLNIPILQSSYTVSVWANARFISDANGSDILSIARANNDHGFLMEAGGQQNGTSNLRFLHRGSFVCCGGDNLHSNTNLDTNTWYHIVYTRDASSGDMSIYINGVLESQITGTDPDFGSNLNRIVIGYIGFSGVRYWDGLLDDLRIYSRALSPDEVSRLYESNNRSSSVTILPNDPTKHTTINTSQNNKLTDGLIGLWSFNGPDISGSTAYDRSGNNNNGTIYGATPTIGKVGQGMGFDGLSGYVEVGDSNIFNLTEDLTISAWVRPESFGFSDNATIFERRSDVYASGYTFVIDPSGLIYFYAYGSSQYVSYPISSLEWTHVVTVRSGNLATLYMNGVAVASSTISDMRSAPDTNTVIGWVSAKDTDRFFHGSLDELRVYDRALSEQEIRQLYQMGGGY